ncbi:MAG TPA: DEAD/DEAH box helicase, partial [Gemmatimonadetes bacterium]|nr:DEAD/DEAH box helicase [Gemmatimonadota bacterium]
MGVPPTHPKAQRYLAAGLFRKLSNFAELEARISALETKQERGDAFEVFVEAFLATQSISQAKHVWATNIPPTVRKKLNLPKGDEGADGAYETDQGEWVAYQAKFRSGRASLSWGELSTFFGLTDEADQRVLLTNSNRVAATAKARSRFHAFRGRDLEQLEEADFKRIVTWLKGGEVKHKPLKPFPHNRAALKNIKKHIGDHDRGRVIMACGTGKTLVALWAAEQAGAKKILVLVPSLSLLQQTLEVWARSHQWGEQFRYLAVCSDTTVTRGVDAISLTPQDLSFRVSTDAAEVNRFLKSPGKAVKVIFSTYQSSEVVAEGNGRASPFDMGIFDEAHKTAGREGTKFSFALKDENLRIKKRLFFTATPRHYNISKKNKEGEASLVYSMDEEATYGPVFHRLSFAKAAEAGVICKYKVLISVVDSETVNDYMLKHGEVLVAEDLIRARQVATQIALDEAVKKSGAQRIITFHSRVDAAKSFASAEAEGVGTHLPGFSTFHVNGKQRSDERSDQIKMFRDADKGLITNARCLTEGIDVPAVDMVAFIAPKKSRVDIVQAVGRAMRMDKDRPEKETGYILV